jgi:hypothetical protein
MAFNLGSTYDGLVIGGSNEPNWPGEHKAPTSHLGAKRRDMGFGGSINSGGPGRHRGPTEVRSI